MRNLLMIRRGFGSLLLGWLLGTLIASVACAQTLPPAGYPFTTPDRNDSRRKIQGKEALERTEKALAAMRAGDLRGFRAN